MESAPRAYRLKASNAAPPISTFPGAIPVHGFNVSFDDSIFKTAQIAFDANFPGESIAFSWPSRGSVTMYDYDRESALASPQALFRLLSGIKNSADVESVYVIAHSLGSQIVADALQMVALSDCDLNLREVVFGAPDVDKDVFAARAASIKKLTKGVTMYASSADKALIVSKTKAGGVPRAGDMPLSGPLLIPGIDLIDVTAVGEDMFALNHSALSTDRSVLDDLGRIIIDGTRPPHTVAPDTVPYARARNTTVLDVSVLTSLIWPRRTSVPVVGKTPSLQRVILR